MNLNEWNARLHGLVIFRALLDDDVIAKLVDLTDRMAAAPRSTGAVCGAAASFESALFEHTTNFGEYLSAAVLEAETVCVRQAAVSKVPPVLQKALDGELDFLQQLCGLTLDGLLEAADAADPEDSDMRALKARKTVRTEQHDLTAELHVHVISPEYGESCRKAAFAE